MAVNLKWCCSRKEGINLIEPNENLSLGYIQMAENAIGTMNREKSLNSHFAISACYYSMYYSLYSVLMKLGIKCEIHTCTLEFMKKLLLNFYSEEDYKIISKAFDVRNTSQYYVDRIIAKEDIAFIFSKAPYFLSKSKEILSKINEKDISQIRKEIGQFIKK
ncbi:MAG: HEPN domain-containing protein [Candidatus Pacearchaeota archaeon]|nr:HEPN domain-containing protein [Candidatus Pacearchaeota archaeon]